MIRLLIAAGVALAFSLIGTKAFMNWLTRHRIGQPIREDGPQGHVTKAGTPTMGGLVIVVAVLRGLGHERSLQRRLHPHGHSRDVRDSWAAAQSA